MTHKSIDALLASTMFLMFTLVTPNFNMVAEKIGVIQSASAIAYSSPNISATSSSSISTSTSSSAVMNSGAVNSSSALKSIMSGYVAQKAAIYPVVKLSTTTKTSTDVKQGSSDIELGSFDFTFTDPAKIDFITFDLIGTATIDKTSGQIISLYLDNKKIGSANIDKKIMFSSLSIPALGGKTKTFTIKISNVLASINGSNEIGKTLGVKLTSYGATDFETNFVFNESLQISGNLMNIIKDTVTFTREDKMPPQKVYTVTEVVKSPVITQSTTEKISPLNLKTELTVSTPSYYDPELPQTNSWVTVGKPEVSYGAVSYTSIAFNQNGYPYVVFKDESSGGKASVMTFDGNDWKYVGGQGFSLGTADSTSIAFDTANTPYVAFNDDGNGATVMKYNGSVWEVVGKAKFTVGAVKNLSLKIGTDNVLYVAFSETGRYGRASVMRYDTQTSAWVNVGQPAFSAWTAEKLSFALDPKNVPYVSYVDMDNNSKITVMKYDASLTVPAWVTVGKAGFHDTDTLFTSLAIDSKGIPYVMFSYLEKVKSDEYRRYYGVFKYDIKENYWVENRISDTFIMSAKADYIFGTAVIAFNQNDVLYVTNSYRYAKNVKGATNSNLGGAFSITYNGSKWVALTNPQSSWVSVASEYESIAINKNGIPYVAFADDVLGKKLRVVRLSNDPNDKFITNFKININAKDYFGNIDGSSGTIKILVPYGTSIKSLAPTIGLSKGASISPASGTAKSFIKPQVYNVTAANGTIKKYTVAIEVGQKVDSDTNKIKGQ